MHDDLAKRSGRQVPACHVGEARRARVRSLRKSILAGTYRVNDLDVADKLIAAMLER